MKTCRVSFTVAVPEEADASDVQSWVQFHMGQDVSMTSENPLFDFSFQPESVLAVDTRPSSITA